ncbi:MAG: TraB/GumN family protein [Paracoccus sp. (in: a-proteobacteria)]|nr:TraB/GumN family protein [Paracoccus sp. (in: a-proteobacteria)]
MKQVLATLILGFAALVGAPAAAQCVGENLIVQMDPADHAELRARTDAVPYHRGLFWRAEKDGAAMTLIGTYHFDHPRHEAIAATFADDIARADALLVEVGPEGYDRLQAEMAANPALIVAASGPTLPERLDAADWQALSGALAERGIPAVVAARMRPWYVSLLLGISPCMMRELAQGGDQLGLDWRLVRLANGNDVPIIALEPWDTAFRMFDGLTPEDEIDMIRYSLPAMHYGDDMTATLADAYADEDVWTIWEFSHIEAYRNSDQSASEVERLTNEVREVLMDRRNRAWIAPLTAAADEAATRGKGVVAAFGALHLPGEDGVLRLLERDGWTIRRIE